MLRARTLVVKLQQNGRFDDDSICLLDMNTCAKVQPAHASWPAAWRRLRCQVSADARACQYYERSISMHTTTRSQSKSTVSLILLRNYQSSTVLKVACILQQSMHSTYYEYSRLVLHNMHTTLVVLLQSSTRVVLRITSRTHIDIMHSMDTTISLASSNMHTVVQYYPQLVLSIILLQLVLVSSTVRLCSMHNTARGIATSTLEYAQCILAMNSTLVVSIREYYCMHTTTTRVVCILTSRSMHSADTSQYAYSSRTDTP